MTGQHDVRLIEWVKHRAREIFLPVAREMQLGVSSPVNPVPHGCEKMSFNRCLFSITVIMGLFFLVNRSDADSLRSVREKVRGSKSSERTESRRKSSRHDDEDRDDDSHHGGILAGVVGQASGGDSHHAGRPRGRPRRHRLTHETAAILNLGRGGRLRPMCRQSTRTVLGSARTHSSRSLGAASRWAL